MRKARKNIVVIAILNICLSLVSWLDIASATMETAEHIIIDFKNTDERENWRIINDDVMGGVSQSEIVFNDTGTATFRGRILSEVPPISPEQIQQVGFMISDKQAGKFRIEIDWIKAYR